MGLNDDLLDKEILRAHYVERFKTFESKKINSILTSSRQAIRRHLLEEDITKWSTRRYEKMASDLREIQRAYNERLATTVTKDFTAFGGQEAAAVVANLERMINLEWTFTTPSAEQVWAAATTNPLMMKDGMTVDLTKFIQGFNNKTIDIIDQTLRQGVILGKPSDVIAREMASTAGVLGRRNADIITRTGINHINSMARKKVADDNADIVKGYEWVSVLDRRTTPVCQYRDTQAWIYTDEDRATYTGELLEGEVYPPAHPRCRSSITYITRSWEELGIPMEEVPKSTRASMNGQVPEDLSYRQWITKQPPGVQKEVLGVSRYNMLDEGKINVDSFYTKDGRMLTLKELEVRGYEI